MISSSKQNITVGTVSQGDKSYEASLQLIIDKINKMSDNSLIIAPELVLTGFDYDNMDKASEFTNYATDKLLSLVGSQILIFTAIVKKDNRYENEAIILHNHKVIHRQSKSRLFTLGGEEKHFKAGDSKDIIPFEINSVKYAVLICFEIRFKELWKAVEGVDIIIVPAQWGKIRENHIVKLSQALAIMNQCFVIMSSSGDCGILELSQIYNPNGDSLSCDEKIKISEVAKIRRYISMETE
jgi:predicted amidohydrolase